MFLDDFFKETGVPLHVSRMQSALRAAGESVDLGPELPWAPRTTPAEKQRSGGSRGPRRPALTQHALGTAGVCYNISEKTCFDDSLEIFMTHTNCKVCVSTPSSQLHLWCEKMILFCFTFITSKYLGAK